MLLARISILTIAAVGLSIAWHAASRPFDRILDDAELAAVTGLDPGTAEYDSNCVYLNLGPGAVAWRDCNGQADQTICAKCEFGGYLSSQPDDPDSKDDNVQPAMMTLRCNLAGIIKKVGHCSGGQCINLQEVPGGCSGSPSIHEPQAH